MITSIREWTIEELRIKLPTILEQPRYQRGQVWSPLKRQMLIDSMFRGIDIPKIYLRKVKQGLFEFEVADGQQRIHAIKEFLNEKFALSSKIVNGLNLAKIGNYQVGDKKLNDLNEKLKTKFLNYKLTIAVVEDSSSAEIRTLFGRLQMGDPLNPAEKRNALISKLGSEIDNIVLNHDFFTNCKIAPERFKRQDYLSHILAFIFFNNRYDLKAPLFQKMYMDESIQLDDDLRLKIVEVLSFMHEIDQPATKRIINKWSFVDIFCLIYEWYDQIESIDSTKFAYSFKNFEARRIMHSAEPEVLITGKKRIQKDQYLYDYIMAFKANGGHPSNLNKRLEAFKDTFKNSIRFKNGI